MADKNVMAADKANAPKATKSNIKLKAYYSGENIEDSGYTEVIIDELDYKHRPWLVKFYTRNGVCHQYADTLGVYHRVSKDMGQILDAIIVNTKQRAAVGKIVDDKLLEYLGTDMAGEKDGILDPCEY